MGDRELSSRWAEIEAAIARLNDASRLREPSRDLDLLVGRFEEMERPEPGFDPGEVPG